MSESSSNVKIGIAKILEKIAEESEKGILTSQISSSPDDSHISNDQSENFADAEEKKNHYLQPIEVSFENIYKAGNLENLAFRCEQAMNNPDLTEDERIIAQLWWCKGQLKAQLIPPVVLYAPVDRATKFLENLDSKDIEHTASTISLAKEVLNIFCNELIANKEYDLLYSFETRLKKLDKKFFKKCLETIEDFKKGLLKTPYFELSNEEQVVKKDVEKEKNDHNKKKKKEKTAVSAFPEELPPPITEGLTEVKDNSNNSYNTAIIEKKKKSRGLSTLLKALLIFLAGFLIGGVSVKFIPQRFNFYFLKKAKLAKEHHPIAKNQKTLDSLVPPKVSRAPLPGSLQMLKYIEKINSTLKNISQKKLSDNSYSHSATYKEVVNTDSPTEPREVQEIMESKKDTNSVKALGIFPKNFVDGRPSSQYPTKNSLLGYFRTLVLTPVRIDPDYLAPVIGNLPPNVIVKALERKGEWLVINYGRYRGYIFAQDVVPER